ncbi:MAG TPA: isoleucine--tRNA ligase [Candidatus Azoamicus sp. OHIO2]
MEYKFTLNLPKTDFSMKASLSNSEVLTLKMWDNYFFYADNNKRKFILNDGPPYANGPIHIGHALNKILKDFICKFKLLCGYNVNFIPGWDCHGLPIELNVEKQITNKNINFRKLCKNYANSQIIIQKKDFIRLGVFANWNSIYKTMNKSFEIVIIDSFIKMLKNNHIYLGYKPNYWCFDCKSALAETEIEYTIKSSDSIYIFFECENLKNILDEFNILKIGFLVWTTTPWTLPFNEAIALNENFKYSLITSKNIGYIINSELLVQVLEKIQITNYVILKHFNAKFFEKTIIKHPLYQKFVNIVFSDHVKNDSGTGCVHIAPAYGFDDYKIALKYKLPLINNIDTSGFFYDSVDEFKNLYYLEANKKIMACLYTSNCLLHHEIVLHRYPICWRHKTPVIFRTTQQWFLNVTNKYIKNKLYYLIENFIDWIPEYGSYKMKSMFKDRMDWCISRQRFWGIPIMLFINKNNELHPLTFNILYKTLKFVKKYGTDFWYKLDVFKIFSIDKENYKKINDVLDVWFDSSVVYKYLNDTYSYKLPYDLCVEGTDQYRGWFQVSLINSTLNLNQIPYKKIISHGFILDEKNRKMSKSLNNVISPHDIINKYGADVLRLWVSSVNYIIDINISNEIIARICDSYRKIRNTFRFLLANIYDFNTHDVIKIKDLFKLDLWILEKFYRLKNEILNDYYHYNFHLAYKKLYNFCINDLGIKYIDIVKDRLYVTNSYNKSRKYVQAIFFYIIYNLLKIFSPILSFTTDEAWNYLIFKDSACVFNSIFNIDFILFKYLKKNNIFNNLVLKKLFYLKDEINKSYETIRKNIKSGSLLEMIINIYCNNYWYNLINSVLINLNLFLQLSHINLLKIKQLKEKKINSNILGFYFILEKSAKIKCERCWYHTLIPSLIKLCNRCILNIYYTI